MTDRYFEDFKKGERFISGFLREVWEVRCEGNLIWGDALHLEDDIERIVDDPACFDGAAAFATLILRPPAEDARRLLDCARALQSACVRSGLHAGATVVSTGPGQYDGIELLADGRIAVSSWADSAVYIISNGTMTKAITGVEAPADIGVDTKRGVIATCLSQTRPQAAATRSCLAIRRGLILVNKMSWHFLAEFHR